MKILYFSHYYLPEGNAPATRVSALAKRWVAAGHKVTVITCAPNVPHGKVYEGYKNKLWPQSEEIDGVRVIRVWTWMAPNKGMFLRIANYLSFLVSALLRAAYLSRHDIVIATSPQFFCGWAGVLYSLWLRTTGLIRRKRTPFVLEIRDIWPESIGAVDAIRNKWILGTLQLLEKWMYYHADRIVTVGDGYRRRLVERGVPVEKISVVMNGWDADLEDNTVEATEAVRKLWKLDGKFVCAYIGTIGMACGLDIYIRAARRIQQSGISDIALVAIGDGAVRTELQNQAERENLTCITFTGLRPKSEVMSWLSIADVCFVHLRKTPLFETVIPSKIFEAAGLKRPILIGVNGDARQLVEESRGGIAFEPENDEQFVDCLLRLKESSEELKQMGENGFHYVQSNFNRDKLARTYLAILQTLLPSYSPDVESET